MKTFEAVKSQIEALPHREYMKLAHWFAERDAEAWSEEMEQDATRGNLDFLMEEALDEKRNGKLRQL